MPTVTFMSKLRVTIEVGLGYYGAGLAVGIAAAQITPPPTRPLEGAALFKQQCGTCHATSLSDPPRQGPPLVKVIGQKAGGVEGFHYSSGFAQANFVWDESKLDQWLTNPQAVIPGAIMTYRQVKPEIRAAIISYLKGLS
jgi:cytochrome c